MPGLIATVVIISGLTLVSSYVVAPWRSDKWNQGHQWTPLDLTETLSGAVQLIIVAATTACLVVVRRVRRAVTLVAARHQRLIKTLRLIKRA